jgi:signal transduction histidine kinase
MPRLRAWLRPPRNLLILFGVVLFLPAATLITLGVRLLDQDRALARQRQGELLEHAADQGVRALEQDLAALRKGLAGPPCAPADVPEDAVCVVLRADRFEAVPPQRIPYFPLILGLREPPSAPFRELEAQEFGEPPNFVKALEVSRKLAASNDASIRAGALLREARVLRAMARPNDALTAYNDLSRMASISINGEPAGLVARRARCAVLEEQSRTRELRQEAGTLAADLRAGRWQLDRETYLYVAGLLSRWLGSEVRPGEQEEALAAGVVWLHKKWTGEAPAESASSGVQVLPWNGAPVTIVWASDNSRAAAFIAGSRFLETHWMAQLQKAASPAQAYLAGVGAAPPRDAQRVQRTAADTGLPWTVVVAGAGGQREPAEFQARRRNLFAGMAAVLVLVAAGSYFLWRSVNRDLAVARLQSDFVSAVSHEFRTPLTALRQFNDLLAEEDGPTPEKRRRYYEAQTRATERLHRLVESLLDFARMEAGRRPYRFERLDAGALARDVTEEFRREADGLGFAVTCSLDSVAYPVAADREALSRALWNLLDNAVKYSGASREIQVEVRRADGGVSIGVRDHGIGIPAAEQKRLFQKFVRGAAARSAGIKGTGLGLAMVRHIVNAHGGTVDVRSVAGEGSAFTIVLPAKG